MQSNMPEESLLSRKYIDLDKSISELDHGLLKKLPGFVIGILKRIIYQNEVNTILNKIGHFEGLEFLQNLLLEFNITIDVEGLENLPKKKKCFFVANHPFGFADGLVIANIVAGKYGTFKAIANNTFMYVPQLHPFIAAIDVFEGSTKEGLRALELIYSQDLAITHFPAGIVSRKINGKIEDYEWQKSFIKKAIVYERDVVPIFFHGKNSNLFYNIFRIRSFFHIKTNLELMLLPSELFSKKGSTIKVTIGKPISYKLFDKSKTHYDWAQWVKSKVYELV